MDRWTSGQTSTRARRVRSLVAGVLAAVLLASGAVAAPEDALKIAFPEAESFGRAEGSPPAHPAYRGERLVGYVFSSREAGGGAGYGGRPLDVVVGLTLDARLTGARLIEHHEPILMIGVKDEHLQAFVDRYAGVDLKAGVRIRPLARAGDQALDAIAGATVSSMALHDAIVGTARKVARSRGLLGSASAGPSVDLDSFEPLSWSALIQEGYVARRRVSVAEANAAVSRPGAPARVLPESVAAPETMFMAVYAALATPAMTGRNILGERLHERLTADLPPESQIVFLAAEGLHSIKGSAWRKSGIFDRLQIVQGARTIALKADRVRAVERFADPVIGELRETLVLALLADVGFEPGRPWRLDVAVEGETSDSAKSLGTISVDYTLPTRLLRAASEVGGFLPDNEKPIWFDVWTGRAVDIGLLIALLLTLYFILIFQDWIARDRRRWFWIRIGFGLAVVLWLGFIVRAQLSVVNVLTFIGSLIGRHFDWGFFLLEPLIFVLWSWLAVAMLFWGRGVFCGWLCPFGALQDFVARAARALKIKQIPIPFGLHERLWPTKYILFLGLFATSLGSMSYALMGAEIEPFKTVFAMRLARDGLYIAYAAGLLAAGLFVERFFCRYLCPLGAALAIPARLRMFEWLKRRRQCGVECQICAVHCPVQAIHPLGQINPNECIHCLRCQTNYHDDRLCPPLIQRRTKKEQRAKALKAMTEGSAS